ncbi:MAG TPA: Crp/Fnr family transcriptional regulator [Polyangiaceae bacterium]|nr:Crp/Fnr family transcriptional regulator [Polyangiaceae bacterium]
MSKDKLMLRAADLSAVELFSGLTSDALDAVLAKSAVCHFARGELALLQGTRSGELHVVVSGAFKASSLTEGGSAVTLAIMGRNEVFGEMAFLDGGTHSANVAALIGSRTLRISASVLESLAEQHPRLRAYLAKVLTARLRRLSTASERMAVDDVTARLARQLLELSERFGAPDAGGTRIMLELPQQELAELVGATRERVNRVLAAWMKCGWVSRRGRQVVLLSRPQLSRHAGLGG